MALLTEENFKVCGLCSQLVDESVMLTSGLRGFLLEFLSIADDILPTKTCLECYQHTSECKRFRDKCDKSIQKLQRNEVYSSMILGRSKQEMAVAPKPVATSKKKPEKIMPNTPKSTPKAEPTPKRSDKKLLTELGVDPQKVDITEGRSSRSKAATPAQGLRSKGPTTKTPKPATPATPAAKPMPRSQRSKRLSTNAKKEPTARVVIKRIDRQRADRHLKKLADTKNTVPVRTNTRKRGHVEPEPLTTPPPQKRARKGYAYEPVPVIQTNGSSGPVSRSSFGRARNPANKKGYIYEGDSFIPDEDQPISSRKPRPASKARARTSPNKATPKTNGHAVNGSAKKRTPLKKPVEVVEANAKVAEVEEEEEDDEEVFPTIGPYQCEICQHITDTKAEFVVHIKENHGDVVDEEVLRSLESDIRKSKKKSAPPPPTTDAAAEEPLQKKKAKPRPKPKPKAKPAAKPAEPKQKTPRPPPKKRGRPPSVDVEEKKAVEDNNEPDKAEVDPLGLEDHHPVENGDPLGGEPSVVVENAEVDDGLTIPQGDANHMTPSTTTTEDHSPAASPSEWNGSSVAVNGNADFVANDLAPVEVQQVETVVDLQPDTLPSSEPDMKAVAIL